MVVQCSEPCGAFSARAASIAIVFLFWFGFVATAGEMTSSLLIGNARIDIMIERTSLHAPVKDIFLWVKAAAMAVTTYYGRFPAPEVLIRITPFEGRGTRDGMTFSDRGGRITMAESNAVEDPSLSLEPIAGFARRAVGSSVIGLAK